MATKNVNNNVSRMKNEEGRLRIMKPVMFEYTHAQKPENFDEVTYDYFDDINKMRGISIVERSQATITSLTKTRVQREADDSSNELSMIAVTKTNTQREVDDSPSSELPHATATSFAKRVAEEDADSYALLLTKTEASREADE